MRLHGQVGVALQALGVGEAPLMTGSTSDEDGPGTPPLGAVVLEEVTRRAEGFAEARQADTIGTADLLFAVLDVYGRLFDRVLYLRGTSRDELSERLSGTAAAGG
jgi:hypothetical protein